MSSFCSAKATHIFSAKNIRILYIESAKTVNEMTLNELVKLTTLWTTGPRYVLYPFKFCLATRNCICKTCSICLRLIKAKTGPVSNTKPSKRKYKYMYHDSNTFFKMMLTRKVLGTYSRTIQSHLSHHLAFNNTAHGTLLWYFQETISNARRDRSKFF